MEKVYNAVCWIGLGILLVFGLVVTLYRAVAIVGITVWATFFSSLPWWERILVAALVAAVVFLVRRYPRFRGHGIPRNTNFACYTPKTPEERSSTFPNTEDL